MLVLEQTHRMYGRATVYISHDAVKVVGRDRDFRFLATAPGWDALLYSDGRKIVHRFPFKQWSASGIKTALNSLEDNDVYLTAPPKLEKQQQYAGVTAQVLSFYDNSVNRAPKKMADYWTSTSPKFPVSEDACRVLCAIWCTRPKNGLPLRFRVMKVTGFTSSNFGSLRDSHLVTDLQTTAIKSVPYDRHVLAAPVGYKNVGDGDIFVGQKDLHDLEEVLGE